MLVFSFGIMKMVSGKTHNRNKIVNLFVILTNFGSLGIIGIHVFFNKMEVVYTCNRWRLAVEKGS
ncbi:MAG: hypothetical protein HY648_10480 [Acidobacteria bacterium]|nr:hypothetical protein [Acidobacteriota bacterium]